jgi:uncharacterized protein
VEESLVAKTKDALQAKPEMACLTIKVTPNARISEVTGWGVDELGRPLLLVKLAAPALEGKANKELLRFMAEKSGCARSEVTLLRGETSRLKAVLMPADKAAGLCEG